MEARLSYSKRDAADMEIWKMINEGLKDFEEGRVYDFDEVFDELRTIIDING